MTSFRALLLIISSLLPPYGWADFSERDLLLILAGKNLVSLGPQNPESIFVSPTGSYVGVTHKSLNEKAKKFELVTTVLDPFDGSPVFTHGVNSSEVVESIAFSRDGKQLIVESHDPVAKTGKVESIDIASKKQTRVSIRKRNSPISRTLLNGGEVLAQFSPEGRSIQFVEPFSGTVLSEFRSSKSKDAYDVPTYEHLSLRSDRIFLTTRSFPEGREETVPILHLVNPMTGQVIREFSGPAVKYQGSSPDEKKAIVSGDGFYEVIDLDTGKSLKREPIAAPDDRFVFSPDGNQVLKRSASISSSLKIPRSPYFLLSYHPDLSEPSIADFSGTSPRFEKALMQTLEYFDLKDPSVGQKEAILASLRAAISKTPGTAGVLSLEPKSDEMKLARQILIKAEEAPGWLNAHELIFLLKHKQEGIIETALKTNPRENILMDGSDEDVAFIYRVLIFKVAQANEEQPKSSTDLLMAYNDLAWWYIKTGKRIPKEVREELLKTAQAYPGPAGDTKWFANILEKKSPSPLEDLLADTLLVSSKEDRSGKEFGVLAEELKKNVRDKGSAAFQRLSVSCFYLSVLTDNTRIQVKRGDLALILKRVLHDSSCNEHDLASAVELARRSNIALDDSLLTDAGLDSDGKGLLAFMKSNLTRLNSAPEIAAHALFRLIANDDPGIKKERSLLIEWFGRYGNLKNSDRAVFSSLARKLVEKMGSKLQYKYQAELLSAMRDWRIGNPQIQYDIACLTQAGLLNEEFIKDDIDRILTIARAVGFLADLTPPQFMAQLKAYGQLKSSGDEIYHGLVQHVLGREAGTIASATPLPALPPKPGSIERLCHQLPKLSPEHAAGAKKLLKAIKSDLKKTRPLPNGFTGKTTSDEVQTLRQAFEAAGMEKDLRLVENGCRTFNQQGDKGETRDFEPKKRMNKLKH